MKLLSAIVVLFAAVSMATATPIQPDIKKLLSTPRPAQHFAPARVGWNGPEAEPASSQIANSLAQYSPAGQQRAVRQTLMQLATPDWRIFLALGVLIFLLRSLRRRNVPSYAPAAGAFLVDADIAPDQRRPAA